MNKRNNDIVVFRHKKTRICVRIAYGRETVEKIVEMGRVGLLPSVSLT